MDIPHRQLEAAERKVNWVRAAVLGANDGLVSTAALVVGVASATDSSGVIFATGIAGLLAGASSMAVGEYVSVSAQRDTQRALLNMERGRLANPWQAAIASAASFVGGAIVPLLAIGFSPPGSRVPLTFLAVVVALALTGYLSAEAGGSNSFRATIRVVLGGIVAMAITFVIGSLFDVSA